MIKLHKQLVEKSNALSVIEGKFIQLQEVLWLFYLQMKRIQQFFNNGHCAKILFLMFAILNVCNFSLYVIHKSTKKPLGCL